LCGLAEKVKVFVFSKIEISAILVIIIADGVYKAIQYLMDLLNLCGLAEKVKLRVFSKIETSAILTINFADGVYKALQYLTDLLSLRGLVEKVLLVLYLVKFEKNTDRYKLL
jgi:hypothetical protein